MDATEFEVRKEELLNECEVAPRIFDRVMPRLERFMNPFVDSLVRREQVEHARTLVQGLLSDLARKNAESIAYRFGQERMPLQWFLGVSPWDDKLLRDELVRQVGEQLGEEDGAIVFDPSAFPKSGTESVGVARQWCGRLGKVGNCQVGIFMGYVSSREDALVKATGNGVGNGAGTGNGVATGNGVRLSLYTSGGRRLCYAKVKAEPVFLSRHAKV